MSSFVRLDYRLNLHHAAHICLFLSSTLSPQRLFPVCSVSPLFFFSFIKLDSNVKKERRGDTNKSQSVERRKRRRGLFGTRASFSIWVFFSWWRWSRWLRFMIVSLVLMEMRHSILTRIRRRGRFKRCVSCEDLVSICLLREKHEFGSKNWVLQHLGSSSPSGEWMRYGWIEGWMLLNVYIHSFYSFRCFSLTLSSSWRGRNKQIDISRAQEKVGEDLLMIILIFNSAQLPLFSSSSSSSRLSSASGSGTA